MTTKPQPPVQTSADQTMCRRPDAARPATAYQRLSRASVALTAVILLGGLSPSAQAGPWAEPGDPGLRHDLQLLVDHGVMNIPLTTWPLSYPDIYAGLKSVDDDKPLPPHIQSALQRVKARVTRAADGRLRASVEVGGNTEPEAFRGFADTPRGDAELAVGAEGGNDRVAFKLKMTTVMNAIDGKTVRFDDSHLSMLLGNWVISLAAVDRWWGPGWDGSLILSNNARPVPAIVLQRSQSTPFDLPVLNWLGPWQLTTFMGQLEHDRYVPDALLWGMRFNFRPLPGLEIGLSRTAQWCGDGRPCDLSTFGDLLLGNDNDVDPVTGSADQPGNQLGGFDLRWAATSLNVPAAIYGQLIGEDEADGWPSKYLGLGGIEAWGAWQDTGASWRGFFELAYTTADLLSDRDHYNVVRRRTGRRLTCRGAPLDLANPDRGRAGPV
ncbi:MAG: capsule assembly Wzi family protein [bacterium]